MKKKIIKKKNFIPPKTHTILKIVMLILILNMSNSFTNKAYSLTNTISIIFKQKSIQQAINIIESKTDYLFVYDKSQINLDRKINLNVDMTIDDSSVSKVLDQLLADTDISYVLIGKNITLYKQKDNGNTPSNNSQEDKIKISGIVIDAHGETIIGANIIEKGSSNGVMTDLDGKFSIKVAQNAILQISCISYKSQEIPVNNKSIFQIILEEDTEQLEEVVVVGYGTVKKKDLTGSVIHASLDNLTSTSNVSLSQSLQGTVAGLNVSTVTSAGASPSMTIRGINTISGSTSPLIILDGAIYRGSIVDINPADIQSVDILKDASATAIYGSQAANGVIILTTKKGLELSKPIIEFNSSYSMQKVTNKDMLPGNRTDFLNKLADCYISASRTGDDLTTANPDWNPADYIADEQQLKGYYADTNTNYWDLLTRSNPYIQSNNISIRGRSKLSGYFLSIGYTDQDNLIINDNYSRYNIRMNLDTRVTDWLKIGFQSFFTLSDYSGTKPTINRVNIASPLSAAYDDDGEINTYCFSTNINPLLEIQDDDLNKRYQLSGNFYVDINIPWIKGLNYRMNLSQTLTNSKHYNYDATGYSFTGSAYKMNGSKYEWTLDNIFTYKREFGKHSFNATAVYGVEKRTYESTTASVDNFPDDKLSYNALENGNAELRSIASSAWKETSLYMMGRLAYIYNNRYFLTGTIRRDGFSGFGKNNKMGTFPSIAGAWRLTEENFMKRFTNINDLKFRISYGKSGNRTISRYSTKSMVSTDYGYLFGDGADSELYKYVSSLENDNLKWETTTTLNFGIDFSILNHRIFGNMECYFSKTNNLLYKINIPSINGFSSIYSNIGEMKNKGQELTITGIPIKRNLEWDITFTFSRNRNKVVSITGMDNDGDGKEDDLIANKIFIGKPYGVCYDYKIDGMWQVSDYNNGNIPNGFTYGTYKIKDLDGYDYTDDNYNISSDSDRKILGYTSPSYRFNIQSKIIYKDFDLSVTINSIQGGSKYYKGKPSAGATEQEHYAYMNSFNFDWWTPENTDARYRQLGAYNVTTGITFGPYISRSFVRLQDVTLGYSLPKKLLNKVNIRNLRVFLSGKNLLTFTDWDGWDPEAGTGLIYNRQPLLKTYTFGINLTF